MFHHYFLYFLKMSIKLLVHVLIFPRMVSLYDDYLWNCILVSLFVHTKNLVTLHTKCESLIQRPKQLSVQ